MNLTRPWNFKLVMQISQKMLEALNTIKILPPKVPIVTNVSATKISGDPDDIRSSLVQQVTGMVRWRESIEWMIKNGITSFVELGAGKVLTGLNKRIDKDVQSIPVESPNAIEELLKILR